jgi:hypothetical protein
LPESKEVTEITPSHERTPSYESFLAGAYLHPWGCYLKVPQTGWLIDNRNVFFTVLEAGSPSSEYQHGPELARAFFWISVIVSSHNGRTASWLSVLFLEKA